MDRKLFFTNFNMEICSFPHFTVQVATFISENEKLEDYQTGVCEMRNTCWVLVSLPLHCLRCPNPLLLLPYWLGLMFSFDLPGSTSVLLSSRSFSRSRLTVEEEVDDEAVVSEGRIEFSRLSFSPPFDPSSQRLVSSTIFSRTRKVSSVCPVSLTTRSTTSCWYPMVLENISFNTVWFWVREAFENESKYQDVCFQTILTCLYVHLKTYWWLYVFLLLILTLIKIN